MITQDRVEPSIIEVKRDESKLCIVVNSNNNIIAWTEPYLINGKLKPSLGNSITINKSDIPNDIDDLGDCRYIDGKVIYSPERVEEKLLADLRSHRQQEFNKYDKYQLPYLQAVMTQEQIQEYDEWRQAWLDVTETKIIPDKPEWFDAI